MEDCRPRLDNKGLHNLINAGNGEMLVPGKAPNSGRQNRCRKWVLLAHDTEHPCGVWQGCYCCTFRICQNDWLHPESLHPYIHFDPVHLQVYPT
jgi:hypothetical protein